MIAQEYVDKIKKHFGDDKKAWDWWKSANSEFGYFSPLAMLKLGKQAQVIKFINNMTKDR